MLKYLKERIFQGHGYALNIPDILFDQIKNRTDRQFSVGGSTVPARVLSNTSSLDNISIEALMF